MQKKLNLQIKYREGFRPFAPSVLEEDAHLYFDLKQNSPYMLFTANIKQQTRKELPEDYNYLPFWERLYLPKSTFPAITHLDFSARIQTVSKKTNPKFHLLLESMKQETGHGILVNTSFNVRGEPIVCTPLDAYRCFMSTDMDYLVIENFLYCKQEQLDFENKEKWKVKVIFD
jgi:carbamoyltransferase